MTRANDIGLKSLCKYCGVEIETKIYGSMVIRWVHPHGNMYCSNHFSMANLPLPPGVDKLSMAVPLGEEAVVDRILNKYDNNGEI